MDERKIDIHEKVRVSRLPYALPSRLREILDGFKWAIYHKNQSAVMVVDGRSGMGKTTLSCQIALYMCATFGLDNVYFTPEEFLEGLKIAKKGDVLVFDEAMLISSRASLSKINRMIVQAMSMIRSKNLLIIFNVNSLFDLDRNLALSRADLLLHCYGDSLTDRGKFLAFFRGGDGMDRIKQLYLLGKKFYSYGKPRSNFNATFSSYFVLDDQEYETRKQVGIDKFLSGEKGGAWNKDKIKNAELIKALLKEGKTQTEIAELMKTSQGNISRHLARYEQYLKSRQ